MWRLLLKVQPAADLRWIHGVQFGAQHLVCCQRHSHGVQLLILAQASVGEIDGWGCEYEYRIISILKMLGHVKRALC